jgi:hypothetical protein
VAAARNLRRDFVGAMTQRALFCNSFIIFASTRWRISAAAAPIAAVGSA